MDYRIQDCNSTEKPGEMAQNDSAPEKLDDRFPFKQSIGSLTYVADKTRPDIAHAVGVASRTSQPTSEHKSRHGD